MKVLFIFCLEPSYERNAMILKKLEQIGLGIVTYDYSSSYTIRYIMNIIKYLLKR